MKTKQQTCNLRNYLDGHLRMTFNCRVYMAEDQDRDFGLTRDPRPSMVCVHVRCARIANLLPVRKHCLFNICTQTKKRKARRKPAYKQLDVARPPRSARQAAPLTKSNGKTFEQNGSLISH